MLGHPLFVREVAGMLRVSEETVRDLVTEGRLKATRLRPRGRLMFALADVEQALQQAGQQQAPPTVPEPTA
jgi:excisionase family DNA binding protein